MANRYMAQIIIKYKGSQQRMQLPQLDLETVEAHMDLIIQLMNAPGNSNLYCLTVNGNPIKSDDFRKEEKLNVVRTQGLELITKPSLSSNQKLELEVTTYVTEMGSGNEQSLRKICFELKTKLREEPFAKEFHVQNGQIHFAKIITKNTGSGLAYSLGMLDSYLQWFPFNGAQGLNEKVLASAFDPKTNVSTAALQVLNTVTKVGNKNKGATVFLLSRKDETFTNDIVKMMKESSDVKHRQELLTFVNNLGGMKEENASQSDSKWILKLESMGFALSLLQNPHNSKEWEFEISRFQQLLFDAHTRETAIDFNVDDTNHIRLLHQLWGNMMPGRSFPGISSEQWKEVGFQGKNPTTDFRALGLLGLIHLIYFTGNYSTVARDMFKRQNEKAVEFQYPFSASSINISSKVLEIFSKIFKEDEVTPHILLSGSNALQEIYSISFEALGKKWEQMNAQYMQFNAVCKIVVSSVEEALSKKPKSIDQFKKLFLNSSILNSQAPIYNDSPTSVRSSSVAFNSHQPSGNHSAPPRSASPPTVLMPTMTPLPNFSTTTSTPHNNDNTTSRTQSVQKGPPPPSNNIHKPIPNTPQSPILSEEEYCTACSEKGTLRCKDCSSEGYSAVYCKDCCAQSHALPQFKGHDISPIGSGRALPNPRASMQTTNLPAVPPPPRPLRPGGSGRALPNPMSASSPNLTMSHTFGGTSNNSHNPTPPKRPPPPPGTRSPSQTITASEDSKPAGIVSGMSNTYAGPSSPSGSSQTVPPQSPPTLSKANSIATGLGQPKNDTMVIISPPVPGETEKQKHYRLRQTVIHEIISTEMDYSRDLSIISDVFFLPIKFSSGAPIENVNSLFSNVEALRGCTDTLLEDWKKKKAEATEEDILIIVDVFEKMSPFLRMYNLYCSNQPNSVLIFEELKKKEHFQKTLNICYKDPITRGLGLMDFLIKPIQRILKYPLFFRNLIDYTGEEEAAYQPLKNCLKKIEETADYINEKKRVAEKLQRIVEIQNSIEVNLDLVQNGRRLVRETTMSMKSGNELVDVFLCLFNDILLVLKKKKTGKAMYDFKAKYNINHPTTRIVDVADTAESTNKFEIHEGKNQASFFAPTKDEKVSWVKDLKLLKKEFQKKQAHELAAKKAESES
eukprot:TRINITY_DN2516_c0_g1_i1.p1 TRINITY_DN2516_c0_g1~~TRINITY_DN2516_c0_g1_i1.p1  ORF type:complete len:1132 (+),score=311.74 TRINITY_DN2516_c0_g1_i1:205-3600(+)